MDRRLNSALSLWWPEHSGSEQPRIGAYVQGHSLACSQWTLIRLLRTARFRCALRCCRTFADSPTRGLLGKWMIWCLKETWFCPTVWWPEITRMTLIAESRQISCYPPTISFPLLCLNFQPDFWWKLNRLLFPTVNSGLAEWPWFLPEALKGQLSPLDCSFNSKFWIASVTLISDESQEGFFVFGYRTVYSGELLHPSSWLTTECAA